MGVDERLAFDAGDGRVTALCSTCVSPRTKGAVATMRLRAGEEVGAETEPPPSRFVVAPLRVTCVVSLRGSPWLAGGRARGGGGGLGANGPSLAVHSGRTGGTDTAGADADAEDDAEDDALKSRENWGSRDSEGGDSTSAELPSPPPAVYGRSCRNDAAGAATLLATKEIGGVVHANAGRLDVLEVRSRA